MTRPGRMDPQNRFYNDGGKLFRGHSRLDHRAQDSGQGDNPGHIVKKFQQRFTVASPRSGLSNPV